MQGLQNRHPEFAGGSYTLDTCGNGNVRHGSFQSSTRARNGSGTTAEPCHSLVVSLRGRSSAHCCTDRSAGLHLGSSRASEPDTTFACRSRVLLGCFRPCLEKRFFSWAFTSRRGSVPPGSSRSWRRGRPAHSPRPRAGRCSCGHWRRPEWLAASATRRGHRTAACRPS